MIYCERLRPAHFAMLRFGFRRVLTAREAAPLPPQPNTRLTNPQIEAVRSKATGSKRFPRIKRLIDLSMTTQMSLYAPQVICGGVP